MGVAGSLNDGSAATASVYEYVPNDYGLYNMAGNVSEWVMDVYRPYNTVDMEEFRPFRGNVYQTKVRIGTGELEEKYDETIYDIPRLLRSMQDYRKAAKNLTKEEGKFLDEMIATLNEAISKQKDKLEEEAQESVRLVKEKIEELEELIAPDLYNLVTQSVSHASGELRYRDVTVEESLGRDNYRQADNIDYLDGDFQSSVRYSDTDFLADSLQNDLMYGYGKTSLVNNRSRVYKGGGWNDRGYWLSPGTRRFLDEDKASAAIGFRCAMDRMGSQSLNSPR